jgi:hypothetical protein
LEGSPELRVVAREEVCGERLLPQLARELRGFGYRIRNLLRGDFQVEGIPEELCERFSKRDTEIDKALAKLLADKPELMGGNLKELRARLAAEKRTRKQKDISRAELRTLWDAQLSEAERAMLRQLSSNRARLQRKRSTSLLLKRCNGRRTICSTATPLSLNVRCGRRRSVEHEAGASRWAN